MLEILMECVDLPRGAIQICIYVWMSPGSKGLITLAWEL